MSMPADSIRAVTVSMSRFGFVKTGGYAAAFAD
jgi:hypothetical protein